MLSLIQQPNPFQPHDLDREILFKISYPQFNTTPGNPTVLNIGLDAAPGAVGRTFVLFSQEFTTDDSVPYTPTSYDPTPGGETSAQNFAGMVRSNPLFKDFSISVEQNGLWVIRMRYNERERLDFTFADDFDRGDTSPQIGITFSNGSFLNNTGEFLWYRFWDETQPISEEKIGHFDDSEIATIDAQYIAGQVLSARDPDLDWNQPVRDDGMIRRIYLKYGTFTNSDNCEPVYGQTYETPEFKIINAIAQPEDPRGIRLHVPSYNLSVRWLTNRGTRLRHCRDSFAWMAVLLEPAPYFQVPNYYFQIEYFDADDNQIGEKIEHPVLEFGVYRFPYGPANPIHDGRISTCAYYKFRVKYGNFFFSPLYANEIRVDLGPCNCRAAEVYFLEDKGSWRTIQFDNIESFGTNVTGSEYTGPIKYGRFSGSTSRSRIFTEGGVQSRVTRADSVGTLRGERITPHNIKLYEEFLRSPRHFILYKRPEKRFNGIGFVDDLALRSIVIDRSAYELFRRGQVTRLSLNYKFNIPQRTRK